MHLIFNFSEFVLFKDTMLRNSLDFLPTFNRCHVLLCCSEIVSLFLSMCRTGSGAAITNQSVNTWLHAKYSAVCLHHLIETKVGNIQSRQQPLHIFCRLETKLQISRPYTFIFATRQSHIKLQVSILNSKIKFQTNSSKIDNMVNHFLTAIIVCGLDN